MHLEHESLTVPPEIEASWLHHRFAQIHPFQDGNGRVARALASLVFIKAGWFPLVVTRDHRARYIEALEEADKGALPSLVNLFSALERKAFVDALGIAREVIQEEERIEQVISSIGDLFAARNEALRREWERAKEVAEKLASRAREKFESVAARLDQEVGRHLDLTASLRTLKQVPGGAETGIAGRPSKQRSNSTTSRTRGSTTPGFDLP